MLPFLAPIIGAAIGGGASLIGANMQNSAAAAASDKQMAFQKESRDTAYQTAMADMKAAGLNPILAYKQGGAGTLSGSTYTPQNVGAAAATGATAGAGVASSAIAATRNQAELANIAADTQLKASQDKTQSAMQMQAIAQAGQANANSAFTMQQTNNAVMQGDLLREQLIQAMPVSQRARFESAWLGTPEGQFLQNVERWKNALSPWSQTAKGIGNTIMTGK